MRPHRSVKTTGNRESIAMASPLGDITAITTTDGIEATADKDSFQDQRVQNSRAIGGFIFITQKDRNNAVQANRC
jgi:hypothetical protein